MLEEPSTNRALIYTSAGAHSNLGYWLRGKSDFDLWVDYYGDGKSPWVGVSDYHHYRKGGKFPNLLSAYKEHEDVFRRYSFIGVFDDDLVITGKGISRLISLVEAQHLALAQPAFDPRGRVSHDVTRVRPWSLLRDTNFVEVTCPVFQASALLSFLEVYDPVLVGWGVDYWFSHFVGTELSGRVAVIDAVTCRNPWEEEKGGVREIDQLQSKEARRAIWDRIKEERKIPAPTPITSTPVRTGLTLSDFGRSAALTVYYKLRALRPEGG